MSIAGSVAISIDERACGSCGLCVQVCPTDVLALDPGATVPEVQQPGECFGCLSCSEICPCACIEHDGPVRSREHHHDPYALHLAARLSGPAARRLNVPSDPKAWQQALDDLGQRLLSMAVVFGRTLGGSLPAVGTMAGKTMARHLPRYRQAGSLAEALDQTCDVMAPAWKLSFSMNHGEDGNPGCPDGEGGEVEVRITDCYIRELCRARHVEPGGELCTLFSSYLAGYVGAAAGARVRMMEAIRGGDACRYRLRCYR